MPPETPPDDFSEEESELLSNLSDLAQSITAEDRERLEPPPDVWAGISNEVFASADPELTSIETSSAELIDLTTQRAGRDQASTPAPTFESERRSPLLLIAAAVVGLAIIGGAAIALLSGTTDANVEFAAEITNAELPEAYVGTANVELDDELMLVIEFDSELPTNEPVELWLIRPDLSDMVSLGIVEPGSTTWEVPAGIDPTEYSVVDLSIEPDDGDPTHSGRSILRGTLASTLDA